MRARQVWSIALLISVLLLAAVPAAAEPPPPRAEPPGAGKAVAPGGEASVAVATASPIGSAFVIRNDPGVAEVDPAVAYNPRSNEFLVVWCNDRPDYPDIQAQRLKWDGTPIGGPFYIATGAVQRRHPAVAYNIMRDEYLRVPRGMGAPRSDDGRRQHPWPGGVGTRRGPRHERHRHQPGS